jgi:hypothetical protein
VANKKHYLHDLLFIFLLYFHEQTATEFLAKEIEREREK